MASKDGLVELGAAANGAGAMLQTPTAAFAFGPRAHNRVLEEPYLTSALGVFYDNPLVGNKVLRIPVTQRMRAWTHEWCRKLAKDLWECYAADAGDNQVYILGSMLFTRTTDGFDVNDGQQRLTTLSVFMLALRRLLDVYSKDGGTDITVLSGCKRHLDQCLLAESKPKVSFLHDTDRTSWEKLVRPLNTGRTPDPISSLVGVTDTKNRMLQSIYKLLVQDIDDLVKKKAEIASKAPTAILAEFISFVECKTVIHCLVTDNESVASKFFEQLNARGVPLDDATVLKWRIGDTIADTDARRHFLEGWASHEFEWPIALLDATPPIVPYLIADVILQGSSGALLEAKTFKDAREHRSAVLNVARNANSLFLSGSSRDLPGFALFCMRLVPWLYQHAITSEGKINASGTTMMRALLGFILIERCGEGSAADGAYAYTTAWMSVICTMLYQRYGDFDLVLQEAASDERMQEAILHLLHRTMRSCSQRTTWYEVAHDLGQFLKLAWNIRPIPQRTDNTMLTDASTQEPAIGAFLLELTDATELAYKMQQQLTLSDAPQRALVRCWLALYDLAQQEKSAAFRDNQSLLMSPLLEPLTIEHIYPQRPTKDQWPNLDQRLINTLGNLLLLNPKQNSSIQNFELKRKAAEYNTSPVPSTKNFAIRLTEAATMSWHDKHINDRSQEIHTIVTKYLALPSDCIHEVTKLDVDAIIPLLDIVATKNLWTNPEAAEGLAKSLYIDTAAITPLERHNEFVRDLLPDRKENAFVMDAKLIDVIGQIQRFLIYRFEKFGNEGRKRLLAVFKAVPKRMNAPELSKEFEKCLRNKVRGDFKRMLLEASATGLDPRSLQKTKSAQAIDATAAEADVIYMGTASTFSTSEMVSTAESESVVDLIHTSQRETGDVTIADTEAVTAAMRRWREMLTASYDLLPRHTAAHAQLAKAVDELGNAYQSSSDQQKVVVEWCKALESLRTRLNHCDADVGAVDDLWKVLEPSFCAMLEVLGKPTSGQSRDMVLGLCVTAVRGRVSRPPTRTPTNVLAPPQLATVMQIIEKRRLIIALERYVRELSTTDPTYLPLHTVAKDLSSQIHLPSHSDAIHKLRRIISCLNHSEAAKISGHYEVLKVLQEVVSEIAQHFDLTAITEKKDNRVHDTVISALEQASEEQLPEAQTVSGHKRKREVAGDVSKRCNRSENTSGLDGGAAAGDETTSIAPPPKLSQVLRRLYKEANKGDVYAQYELGRRYYFGRGVDVDYSKAMEWFRKAAGQRNANAEYSLGLMHEYGQGVPVDSKESVKWYRKAADQGHADAQNNLGCLYKDGEGVAQDFSEALRLFNSAAELGCFDAFEGLGEMYRDGLGIPKDEVKAASLFQRAIDGNGCRLAQYKLGKLLYDGSGIEQNKPKAIELFRLSAAQGCEEAIDVLRLIEGAA